MHDFIDILKKFRKILTVKQKRKMILLVLMMIVGALLEVFGVSLVVPLISMILDKDFFVSNEVVALLSDMLGIKSVNTFIVFMLLALAFVYIFKDIFLFFEYYIQLRFTRNNKIKARINSMWVYLNKPYDFYFHAKSGELIREASTDITNTYNMLQELLSFTTEAVIAVFLIVTVFVVDTFMAIFVSVMLFVEILIIYKRIKPILSRAGKEWASSIANSNKWMIQSFDGIKEIKIGKREAYFLKKFDEYATESSKSEFVNGIFSNVPRLLIEAITISTMLVVVAGMVFLGVEIETVLPKLSAFAVAAVKLLPSANRISTSLNQLMYNKVCLDNVSATLLSGDEKIKIEKNKIPCGRLKVNKNIELKDITFIYPRTDKIILRKANMNIPAGSMIGIIGASGSGKTTSVDLLLGLLKEQNGDVLVDGVAIGDKRDELLENVGYIPQHIFLLDGTIRENVAFGLDMDEVDENRVWECLDEAEMESFVRSLPYGLETEIGEKGICISGGQKQRIGIARALYHEPEILIFDEATSALDNDTEGAIIKSINKMHGRKTIIIIAHRMTTIENCDIVYRVENEKIIRVEGKINADKTRGIDDEEGKESHH